MSNPAHSARPQKSLAVAYVLLVAFLGVFGIHQFYLGKVGRGLGYLLTFGWLGVGPLIDLFTLPAQVRAVNFQRLGLDHGPSGVSVNVVTNQSQDNR